MLFHVCCITKHPSSGSPGTEISREREQAGGVVYFVSGRFDRVLSLIQVTVNETNCCLEAGQNVNVSATECKMLLRGCVASFAAYCNNARNKQVESKATSPLR